MEVSKRYHPSCCRATPTPLQHTLFKTSKRLLPASSSIIGAIAKKTSGLFSPVIKKSQELPITFVKYLAAQGVNPHKNYFIWPTYALSDIFIGRKIGKTINESNMSNRKKLIINAGIILPIACAIALGSYLLKNKKHILSEAEYNILFMMTQSFILMNFFILTSMKREILSSLSTRKEAKKYVKRVGKNFVIIDENEDCFSDFFDTTVSWYSKQTQRVKFSCWVALYFALLTSQLCYLNS